MALLSAGTVFVFIFLFALAFMMQRRAHETMTAAHVLAQGATEINILTSRYLGNPQARHKAQWVLTYNSLLKVLREMPVREAEIGVVVNRMLQNLVEMKALFTELDAVSEKAAFELSASNNGVSTDAAARATNKANALIKTAAELTGDAFRLLRASDMQITNLNHRIVESFTVFSILLALAVLLSSRALSRSISDPINRLRAGTEIIGSGNLDFRTSIRSDDEIGRLSESFDHMTTSLKAITVSRDELAREIAERKRTEEELERSNRELEQFAYVASHDLQEPLRMVASYVQLLERKYKGRLDEPADKYIHFAADGALRMQKLIEGLLAYSRVTTRGGEFKRVDLNQVFHDAVSNLSAAIQESRANVAREELPKVSGEETQLLQLLQNLIGNAVKFRKPDVPPQVHISAQKKKSEWVFEVRDNGIGIKKENFDKLFQIFQRLHTREEYAGTGIGLAVCKKIVERHGGRIWLDSVPGEGTSFFFTIPFR